MLGFHGWLHVISTVTIAVLLSKYVVFQHLTEYTSNSGDGQGQPITRVRKNYKEFLAKSPNAMEGHNEEDQASTHTLDINLHQITPMKDITTTLSSVKDGHLFAKANLTRLTQQGSSVWCWGEQHTDRICRFQNLCYMPDVEEFVFFHSPQSIMSGLNIDRFDPTLLDMSSVWDHNMQYFNFVDLPATKAESFKVEFLEPMSLIFRRFNPDNLMHVIHDDLFPMYYTLNMITGGYKSNISAFDVQLVFMEGWNPGDFINLYEAFSIYKPLFKSDLTNKDTVTCFRDSYIGISKETTWYQYGFREPQGPIPNSQVTGWEVRQFTSFFKLGLGTDYLNAPNGEGYIVMFTRKHNRLIINEVDLTLALVRQLKTKVLSVGVETHSVTEMIAVLSKASILIGMHGSLLSLAMFLPPSAILVELFPYAVNPNNYTPYRTLANLKGMGLIYCAWQNMNVKNTVSHPTRQWDTGGIAHLTKEMQDLIASSTEVPKHLCCRDPEWLYRIYQDTVVDIPSVISLIQGAIQQRDKQFNVSGGTLHFLPPDPTEVLLYKRIFPSPVQKLVCEGNQGKDLAHNENTFTPPTLWLSWQMPWNLKYLEVHKVNYELWIQESGQENYTAWLLSKTTHQISSNLKTETSYNIWVRCIINDHLRGPFNQEHISCST